MFWGTNDGLDVVQERNEANEVTAQIVRDGNIGGILSRSTSAGASFFGYDGSGNVTLLSDASGNEVGRYRYDAFGNTLEISGVRASENPYRFSTKELHGASGLYDFGFLFYSASMGRWINRDPIREDGGLNLYAMVGNNPLNAVDDYGLQPGRDKGERNKTARRDGGPDANKHLRELNPPDPKRVFDPTQRQGKGGTVARPPGMDYKPPTTPKPPNPPKPNPPKPKTPKPNPRGPNPKGPRRGIGPGLKGNVIAIIIQIGVEACVELWNYKPGKPSGPITGIGERIGEKFYP